ncbi:hypothetical protein AB0B30_03850 [Streptomyces narbonensis]|uniref:Uncharacterized protein n=1 Tax=Streptomyces narbonensis TaxID=67333 RepID=A0ABV3C5R2_9ACTN
MASGGQTTDAEQEKDRERWMARFQVRLAMQPGVDRAIVLQAVEDSVVPPSAASPRRPV